MQGVAYGDAGGEDPEELDDYGELDEEDEGAVDDLRDVDDL